MTININLPKNEIKIGVISDTHGLLRPKVIRLFKNDDLIIHAGDVGDKNIIDELNSITKTFVVKGNVDTENWASRIPDILRLKINDNLFYLIHNIGELKIDHEKEKIDCIIFGHSHQPLIKRKNKVLYFNPGSAGKKRFSLPITLGRLRIKNGKISARILKLISD